MAKKKTGQRNFFRFMTLIGVVVIGGIGYGFFMAAPNLNSSDYHKNYTSAEECLQCHVRSIKKAPIMPHRAMEKCTFCHHPAKSGTP